MLTAHHIYKSYGIQPDSSGYLIQHQQQRARGLDRPQRLRQDHPDAHSG